MNSELLDRIKNCKTLPAVPALPLQVLQLCRREDADIKKLGDLISKDPTFVAKTLNIANSSFYGGSRQEVTTVTQAITLLGMNSIATLAFCFSLYRDLRRHGGSGFNHAQFWQRSILASVAGRTLGVWSKAIECEEIFLAALLQDIGILVLSETHAESYVDLMTKSAGSHARLEELERQHIGADHTEVGAWLAENWRLPEVLQSAIRGSHDPTQVKVPDESQKIIRCVVTSGRLADVWCDPQTEQATQEAAKAAQEFLKMESNDLITVLTKIADGFLEMSTLFQMDLGNPKEIQSTLEIATKHLQSLSPSEPPQPASVS